MATQLDQEVSVELVCAARERYAERFGEDADDCGHPSLMQSLAYMELLDEAVQRGTPLTQDEADARLGGPFAWDW